jgi:hypothetical protein
VDIGIDQNLAFLRRFGLERIRPHTITGRIANLSPPAKRIAIAVESGLTLELVLAFLIEALDRRVRDPIEKAFRKLKPWLRKIAAKEPVPGT